MPQRRGISLPTIIATDDADAAAILRELVERVEDVEMAGDVVSVGSAVDMVTNTNPVLFFIQLDGAEEEAFQAIEELSGKLPNLHIIALSATTDDAGLVLQTVRRGAREFLNLPLEMVELQQAINRVRRIVLAGASKEHEGEIYAVFSGKGGCGVTTVATNLAVVMAGHLKQSVALVDLCLQLGDVSMFLNLVPRYTISDVVQAGENLDAALLTNYVLRHGTGVHVLAEPQMIEEAEGVTPEHIEHILNLLKTIYDYVIVDTPNQFNELTIKTLDMADKILLVSDMLLPGIRNTKRCLRVFEQLEYNRENIIIIANRYTEKGDIVLSDVEKTLKVEFFCALPNDHRSVMASINRGIPLLEDAPKAPILDEFKKLAVQLTGEVKEEESDAPHKKWRFFRHREEQGAGTTA